MADLGSEPAFQKLKHREGETLIHNAGEDFQEWK